MIKQIFTFGYGQLHQGGYTVIEAETRNECRKEMHHRYGRKWAFQYDSEEDAGVERFGLRLIK